MMYLRIAIILIMCWFITSCDALSSDTDEVDKDTSEDDDDDDDDDNDTPTEDCNDDEQCCIGNVLSICKDGDWEEWDDCASYGQICTVRKGEHLCADKSGDETDDEDTESGATDDTDEKEDSDDKDTGEGDSETEAEPDTGEDSDDDPVPDVEGQYADLCNAFCLHISHCGLLAPDGTEYRDSLTWYTDQRHCAANCTTETNEKLELVMISCEQAEFDLFICEMEVKSCDDLQLLINARGETSQLPCGDRMDDVLEACY